MRLSPVAIAIACAIPVFAGCFGPGTGPPPLIASDALEPRVTLHTSMGDITMAIYEQQVPLTGAHFIALVQSGFYNGTRFTRIVPGYDIQAGDATSRDGDPATWPAAPVGKLWDEFHPGLRHDRAGLVSMVNYGPDTGKTEFFITTAAAPFYDDRYSLFAHVVGGMDVVDAIAAIPVSGNGTYGPPAQAVTITGATFVRSPLPDGVLRYGAAMRVLTADKTTEAGRNSTFAVIVTNTGNVRDLYDLTAQPPPGWTARFENTRLLLPAGRSWVMLLDIAPPAAGNGSISMSLHAQSTTDPNTAAQTAVTVRLGALGPAPKTGDTIRVEYTGALEDGRIFETSIAAQGQDPSLTKMASVFHRDTYGPYNFTIGPNVVAGFDLLALRTRVGETTVARVPASLGYTDAVLGNSLLYLRPLVFEMRILP